MADLARGFLFANLAAAIELGAGLDHQFADRDIAADLTAGGNFEALGVNGSLEAATDQDAFGRDFAVDGSLLADRDLRFAADGALEATVYVQAVAQGKVADQLGACCNDGRSGTLAVFRTISANDSHWTRSSFAKSTS